MRALREYAARRGWTVVEECKEVGSGAVARAMRQRLIDAARRLDIDVVLVWRLDRWGRSVADLVSRLQELTALGVRFVSVTEALDLTTPAGRAMAGLLSVLAEFERDIMRERVRVRAGLAHARLQGKRLGRPPTAAGKAGTVRDLFLAGISKSEITRRLKIGRISVRRLLGFGANQKLTTCARIKLTTSKTPIATWHGTASVGSSPPPQAHKSFNGYRGGVLIRAARPRATRPHSARISRNLAPTGGQLFVSRGGSFLASAEAAGRKEIPIGTGLRRLAERTR
jgi:DNA invertase Pin-like site-specific DNA recombinase